MTAEERSREGPSDYPLAISAAAIVASIGFTVALVRFVAETGAFVGDDYFGFWIARTGHLLTNLGIPVGSQVVPLHRIVDHTLYHLLPGSYLAALGVLVAFHGLTVLYLYRTLEQLGRSAWNPVLVCVYVVFVHTWVELAWWSAGLQRLPFGALSMMAIFYYLRYSETRRTAYLVAVSACTLGALGFYGKAVLVPLLCAGLDAARRRRGQDDRRFDLRDRKRWAVLAGLTIAGLVFIPVARALAHEPSGWGDTSPSFQLTLIANCLTIFGHALLGWQLHFPRYEPSWAIGGAWLLLLCYTVWRARSSVVTWGIGLALLALNTLMIGLSNRSHLLGAVIPFEPRYYFDLLLVAVPFIGAILHQIPGDTPEARWLGSSWRAHAAPLVLSAGLLVLGAASFRNVSHYAYEYSRDMPRTRQYVTNLTTDLAQLETGPGEPRTFEDGSIPTYISGFDVVFRRHSQLFLVLHAQGRFVGAGEAAFRVDESGHVAPASPRH